MIWKYFMNLKIYGNKLIDKFYYLLGMVYLRKIYLFIFIIIINLKFRIKVLEFVYYCIFVIKLSILFKCCFMNFIF